MLETLALLLAAHVFGDFVLQRKEVAEDKTSRRSLIEHAGLHLLALWVFLPGFESGRWAIFLIVVFIHLLFDVLKASGYLTKFGKFGAFLVDQALHVAVLAAVAVFAPALAATSLWFQPPDFTPAWLTVPQSWSVPILSATVIVTGAVFATRAGGFAVQMLVEPFREAMTSQEAQSAKPDTSAGLDGAGAAIGHLERILIYALVLLDQFAAIGFLIAAKSALRFQYAQERSHSEYVIIGTLASFAWAAGTALAVRALV